MSYHPPSRSNVVLTVETDYSPPDRLNIVLVIEAPGLLSVRDVIKGVDRGAFKEIGLYPRDSVKAYDYKGFVVSPLESVKPVELLKKDVTRVFSDVSKTYDWKGFAIDLRDCIVDEGYMSKGILWHFREWWITVKDFGPFREVGKHIVEVVRAYDYKGFVVEPKDLVISYDLLFKEFGKVFVEPVKAVDVLAKDVLAHVLDTFRPEERLDKYYRGVMEVMDVASSVDFLSKGVSSVLRDEVRGYDFKGFVPELVDAVRVVESRVLAGRGITCVLIDRFVDEGWVAKVPARGLRDAVKPSDFLLKVAFTLFGEAARRVYFHKVHGDIILPEDHNVRNLAAQALVEAVKRLKDKLDQM